MIPAEQLQRFSRECLLLRKALQEGQGLPDVDYRILKSHITMLLTDLENCRSAQSTPVQPQIKPPRKT